MDAENGYARVRLMTSHKPPPKAREGAWPLAGLECPECAALIGANMLRLSY